MSKIKCGRGIVRNCYQSEECSHWLVFPMTYPDGSIKDLGNCVDWWDAKLKMEGNKIAIGRQQAIESLRNEMAKPDLATLALVGLLAKEAERKKITG